MTLTEVSFYTRKFMPVVIILVLVLCIFYFAFQLFTLYVATQQGDVKNRQVVLNTIFNKIKAPVFADAKASTDLNFVIDTIEGTPLAGTDSAKVFFLPQSPQRFGFLQKIYSMAEATGIDTNITKHKLADKDAVFSDGLRTMTINISDFNFNYQYTLSKDDPILVNPRVPNPIEIENKAIDFLRSLDRYPEELAQGKKNIVFLRYDPQTNELAIVQSAEEANMAEVDFYRPDIEGMSVVTPKYYNSQHYVVMAFNDNDFKVVRAQVHLYEKSTAQIGLYPMKSGPQAWEELKAGKGFVVSKTGEEQNVNIKKMFIGYYDPENYQEYLQPVYVFLGDNNFVGYVPGVTDEYLLK